jgi:nucleoside-diphosphate-sugar epimerase
MKVASVAITGASGYIGSHIAAVLKREGYGILAMGRRPVAGTDGFIPFALGLQNDYAALEGMDMLIHCAYDFTCLGQAAIRRINGAGSATLFKEAKARGVKRIVFISSLSAFENALSDYGRVKFETEVAARAENGLIVRPGLVFGRDAGGIVGALYRLVQRLPCLPVVGKGDQPFYPCHIDDLCSLAMYLAAREMQEAAPINAACERTVTFREIVQTLADAHGKRVTLIPLPYMLIYAALKGAELLDLKTDLRSDSLKYMRRINPDVDFGFVRREGIAFREFTAGGLNA